MRAKEAIFMKFKIWQYFFLMSLELDSLVQNNRLLLPPLYFILLYRLPLVILFGSVLVHKKLSVPF